MRIGAVAQLGERVLCKHEVGGSIPLCSTESIIIYALSRQIAKMNDGIPMSVKNHTSGQA